MAQEPKPGNLVLLTFLILTKFAIVNAGPSFARTLHRAAHLPPPSKSERADLYRYYSERKYMKYPKSVRLLIRRADSANGICRNATDAQRVIGHRACDLRDRATALIEARGWCWGGSDTYSEQRWLPCAQDGR